MEPASTPAKPSGHSRFWTWLQGIAPYPRQLAWCHNTDGWALRDIIFSGVFQPTPCHVFGEKLLYFFYGRPAYRSSALESMRISSKAPVAILLDQSLAPQGKRMYPFDTGAFVGQRYAAWMHPSMGLSDFEMACPSDGPQRHVSSFFGSNSAYLRLQAQPPSVPMTGEFEAESLAAMLADSSIMAADDRRIAVELQVGSAIAFEYPIVRAIIMPDELNNAPFVKEFIAGAGKDIDVLTYSLSTMKRALDYQVPIEERATQLQESWGWG